MPRGPIPVDVLVGQNIRFHRLRKGWSQTRLARTIGVSFQQVQKYESGTNRVGAGMLVQIAGALGVSLVVLFEGSLMAANPERQSVRAMLARPHALRLLQGFDRIGDERIRVAVVRLVERLAGGDE